MGADRRGTFGFEPGRMISFSDGVVAIAMTLLILPLVDIEIPENNYFAQTEPLSYVWQSYNGLITSFVISWFVIIIFWVTHHRIFSSMALLNSSIVRWNIIWLFSIVVFPFPTSLLSQSQILPAGRGAVSTLYLGNMFLISLALTMISRQLRINPDLVSGDSKRNSRNLTGEMMSTYLAILLALSFWLPSVALWGLIGLGFVGPISARLSSRLAAQNQPQKSDPAGPADKSAAE